jgi:MOSC domain-containing protein YiiM
MPLRIVSLRVGRPIAYPIAGNDMDTAAGEFFTAIIKHEVEGPVPLSRLGLAGDQVADTRAHGGVDQALLAYSAAHYPRWRAEWGRSDVAYGGFGENLTVEGADEDVVCLGDRWRIGDVVLEVTKPRSPCHRLAWRQQRDDLIQRVRETGRSGWYLRVLVEGALLAGSEVSLESRGCPALTVRRAALAMANRDQDPDEARLLLACDALAADWRYRLAKEGFRRPGKGTRHE